MKDPIVDPTWQTAILPAGTVRRVHVLVPELIARLKAGLSDHRPVWAIRSAIGNVPL